MICIYIYTYIYIHTRTPVCICMQVISRLDASLCLTARASDCSCASLSLCKPCMYSTARFAKMHQHTRTYARSCAKPAG